MTRIEWHRCEARGCNQAVIVPADEIDTFAGLFCSVECADADRVDPVAVGGERA